MALTLAQLSPTPAATVAAEALTLALSQESLSLQNTVAVAALALTLAQANPTISAAAIIEHILDIGVEDLWL